MPKKGKTVASHKKTKLPSENLSVEAAKMGSSRAYPEPRMTMSMKKIVKRERRKSAPAKAWMKKPL